MDDLRAALALRAAEIAQALLGPPTYRSRSELRWRRRGSLAMVISGSKAGLWHDHESGEGGDIIALIQRERRCGFAQAVAWARSVLGTAPPPPPSRSAPSPPSAEEDTAARALALWHQAHAIIDGTPADIYLRARGIDPARLPPHSGDTWPPALRWHPRERALVIGINDADSGVVRAVQLIAVNPDGTAVVRDGRKLKLTFGALRGRAVRFGWLPSQDERWALAEGAETALAAAMLLHAPCWAALGAANMPHVTPPAWARKAIIVADHDEAGLSAAEAAAERLRALGLEATTITPVRKGNDAADLAPRERHER